MKIDAAVATKQFNEGDVLFSEGERSREMYILVEGSVRIVKKAQQGKTLVLAEVKEGSIIGEMALISREPRSATAIAATPLTVKIVSPDSFEQSSAGIPPWAMCLARTLVLRLRNVNLSIENKSGAATPSRAGAKGEDGSKGCTISIDELKANRVNVAGYFFRKSTLELQNVINMMVRKKTPDISIDFSETIDIDHDAIKFLSSALALYKKQGISVTIQNTQLIHSKVQTSATLASIVQTLEPPVVPVSPGVKIITQDSEGDEIYIVKSGSFKVTRTVKGKEELFGEVGAGDVIGEMALLAGGKRAATVTATTPSVLYKIKASQFETNEYNIPHWFLNILKQLVGRIRFAGLKFDKLAGTEVDKEEGEIDIQYQPDQRKTGLFKVSGYFDDRNLLMFENKIVEIINLGFSNLVFDLSDVPDITTEYIKTFIRTNATLKKNGGALHLIRANETVNLILQRNKLINPLIKSIEHYKTSEALTLLDQGIDVDSLSGLYHKGKYNNYLEKELKRCFRYKGNLSLLLLTIDRFSDMADDLETKEKEETIRQFGQLIKEKFRSTDVAGRLEEYLFAVTLPGANIQDAIKVAHKFQSSIKEIKFGREENLFEISCSGGIVMFDSKENGEALIARAKEALSDSQKNGYNKVTAKLTH